MVDLELLDTVDGWQLREARGGVFAVKEVAPKWVVYEHGRSLDELLRRLPDRDRQLERDLAERQRRDTVAAERSRTPARTREGRAQRILSENDSSRGLICFPEPEAGDAVSSGAPYSD